MSKYVNTSFLVAITVVISLFMAACGKDEKIAPKQVAQPARTVETPAKFLEAPAPELLAPEPRTTIAVHQKPAANYDIMLGLARKSGCLSCHSIDKKVVGPAWKDVATRYKNKKDARVFLVEKVSKGGRGNWIDVVGNVAMPPYSPRVSKENIELLVDFVLSL